MNLPLLMIRLACFYSLNFIFAQESPRTVEERKPFYDNGMTIEVDEAGNATPRAGVGRDVNTSHIAKCPEYKMTFWRVIEVGATTSISFIGVLGILYVGVKLVQKCMKKRSVDPHSVRRNSDKGSFGEESQLELTTMNTCHQVVDAPGSTARWIAAHPETHALDMRTYPFLLELHIFKLLGLREIPLSNINVLRILGEGEFGTVFVGEMSENETNNKSNVTVKNLMGKVEQKEKYNFIKKVRALSCQRDPNFARVLGICIDDQSIGVVVESLEFGDLCRFLESNDPLINDTVYKKLESKDFLSMFCQLASGMKYLARKKILHMDLAARNCIVGKGLRVKLSYFAMDMDAYAADYCLIRNDVQLPIRWMSWESVFKGEYSEKSDVWSFGVLMWEALTYCRHRPYPTLDDENVLTNLALLPLSSEFCVLEKLGIHNKLYSLMLNMWVKDPKHRPSFGEIHSNFALNLYSEEVPSSSEGSTSTHYKKEIVNVYVNPGLG